MTFKTALCLGAAALLTGSLALAQGTAPRDPNMPNPNTVPAEKTKPAEKTRPAENDATGSTNNLSDTLRKNEGVITPPSTGNEGGVIRPAPEGGTTPVIPPRGGPGDTQQPK